MTRPENYSPPHARFPALRNRKIKIGRSRSLRHLLARTRVGITTPPRSGRRNGSAQHARGGRPAAAGWWRRADVRRRRRRQIGSEFGAAGVARVRDGVADVLHGRHVAHLPPPRSRGARLRARPATGDRGLTRSVKARSRSEASIPSPPPAHEGPLSQRGRGVGAGAPPGGGVRRIGKERALRV